MKQLFLIGACALLIVSCKKEENEPVNPANPSYTMPSTEGSYWVYHWTKIDSTGAETPLSYVDTVRITGTVTQDGYTWTEYTGSYMGGLDNVWLQRDSSGYIIKSDGQVQYSYVSTAPFITTTDAYYDESTQMGAQTTLSTPWGTLTVLDRQKVITRASGSTLPGPSGVNACGDASYTFHTYFASGIGEVRHYSGIYSSFINDCTTMRRDLVAYHIE